MMLKILLKRGIKATYHKVTAKHIQKYADMFSFRWNTKSLNEVDRINENVKFS